MEEKFSSILGWMGFSALLLATLPADAALFPESIKPFARASIAHDDNLFRDASNEVSDTIYGLGAGVGLDLDISRQSIKASAEVVRKSYSSNDYLNSTDIAADVVWDWRVGRLWTGALGYDFSRGQRSFTQTSNREKDIRTAQRMFAEIYQPLTPTWRLKLRGEIFDLGFDRANDVARTEYTQAAELQYRTGANTYLGVIGELVQAAYDRKELVGSQLISNDYDETSIGVVGRWEASDRSNLSLRLSQTQRDHDELSQRDFDGLTARASYIWKGTGKLRWLVNGWSATSAAIGIGEDETTSVIETLGLSLEPIWNVTAKVTARLRGAYEDRDYTGDAGLLISGQNRQDKIISATFQVIYRTEMLRNGLDFALQHRYSDRDSNSDAFDYTFNYTQLSATANF